MQRLRTGAVLAATPGQECERREPTPNPSFKRTRLRRSA